MLYFIHIVLRKISLFQAHNYVIVRICFTRRLLVCRIIFLFFNFIKRRKKDLSIINTLPYNNNNNIFHSSKIVFCNVFLSKC